MNINDFINNNLTLLDGGFGTMLQKTDFPPGELPERWNISHPEVIIGIHTAYYDAGSNVINTNTFGANPFKYKDDELKSVIEAGVKCANIARVKSFGAQEKFIAYDLSTLGRLIKPFGNLDFDDALKAYSKIVNIAKNLEIDLFFIETMNDSYDTKAALLAVKENCDLPVFVSNAYDESGKLVTGANPLAMVSMLEGLGADAIGINCSLGPKQLKSVVEDYLKYSSLPVILKPNAGLPQMVNKKTVYNVLPEEFCEDMKEYVANGVRLAGGCCGTTPEYISKLYETVKGMEPVPIKEKEYTMVSSHTHGVIFDKSPIIIGERINPTGNKKLKEDLKNNGLDVMLNEAIKQQEEGAHILDVNVGLPEIDEVFALKRAFDELIAVTDLPLQIDTANPEAMEPTVRRYNGKVMINSLSGKQDVMDRVFPIAKKYGAVIVCLTLDDDGIPKSAEGRIKIAKKIIKEAQKYDIKKKDLIFDPLAMTVSADSKSAKETLKAINVIKNELGCHTVLGISNISFGLPYREAITSTFYVMALEKGLSAAIMNPGSVDMMKAYYSYRALKELDDKLIDYVGNIERYKNNTRVGENKQKATDKKSEEDLNEKTHKNEKAELKRAIIKGLKNEAKRETESLLSNGIKALDIVSEYIIPALNDVGDDFEQGISFLPQLLMSAEAAQNAFLIIKEDMKKNPTETVSRGKFVLATVKGDIHDIGKNIVKLILENYGFEVIDLGKDVPARDITDATIKTHAEFVGLSALMTTTVPFMEETVEMLKKEAPWAKIVVGGAVLTQEYSDKMGADCYGSDAMSDVKYALKILEAVNENN